MSMPENAAVEILSHVETAESPESLRIPLSSQELEELATGQWGEATAQKLSDNEWSRCKLDVYALLQELKEQPEAMGPLAPLDEAVHLLGEAEARDPQAVRELLQHPTVGQWLAHTRQRLREGAAEASEERPLWADVGYAHSLAAVAAHRAGLDATLCVPVHSGRVILPTLGRATLPSAAEQGWETAEVCTGNGVLAISNGTDKVIMPEQPQEDAQGWEGTRWLTFTASNGETWKVLLDDLDEFSGLQGPAKLQRLSQAGLEAWGDVLGEAWELLATKHSVQARQIAGVGGLRVIVPQLPKPRFQTYSSSSGSSPGSATMSRPHDAVETALTLVHEYCGHTLLNLLFHSLQLLQPQEQKNHNYAPWRDDPRPLGGLLHGVVAFSVVAKFWCDRYRSMRGGVGGPDRKLAAFDFAYWRDEVYNGALELLSRRAELTKLGNTFVHQLLKGLIDPLREVVVPRGEEHMALVLSLDHVLKWSGHHLQLSESVLEGAAKSWESGHSAPPPELFEQMPALVPNPNARGLDVAAVLVRLGIVSPGLLHQPAMLPREATPADVALATFLLRHNTDFPASGWGALEQAMVPLLEAQRGTPQNILTALYARINRDSRRPPPLREVTQWLASGMLTHLRRHGDDVLLPRYFREGDEQIVQETLRQMTRDVKAGELPVIDALRVLVPLGCLVVGTAVSQEVYNPHVLVTNIPPPSSRTDIRITDEWQARVKSTDGSALPVVRAGRDAFIGVWGAAIGDPHQPFQREELGLSLLPSQWNYDRGYGGWVYRGDNFTEGGYVGIAHVDFVEAIDALPSDMIIGAVDLLRDDQTFTGQVPFEPGNAVSPRPHKKAGSFPVRAGDVHPLLSDIRPYTYTPSRRHP